MRPLKTDRVDLYLQRWSGSVALVDTMDAFARLQQAGQIRSWGDSNIYINIISMGELETLSCRRGVQASASPRTGIRARHQPLRKWPAASMTWATTLVFNASPCQTNPA